MLTLLEKHENCIEATTLFFFIYEYQIDLLDELKIGFEFQVEA